MRAVIDEALKDSSVAPAGRQSCNRVVTCHSDRAMQPIRSDITLSQLDARSLNAPPSGRRSLILNHRKSP